MKTKALALAAILLMAAGGIFAQSVIVTKKKIVYTRPKSRDEYKKHFDIEWPKVKAATPALSRRIENALSYERVLGLDLNEELRGTAWLHEASFDVEYNKKGILGVMMFMEGSGAYASGTTKRVLIDTRTGNLLRPNDLFTNLPGLTALVKRAHRAEIVGALVDLKKDPENADIEDTFKESAQYPKLGLSQMTVTDKGVTFYHDYGFPHLITALQPDGEYVYTWKELRPYIKRNGAFAKFAR